MPQARWNGPFDAFLPDSRTIRVGDILDVSDEQAQSAHWQPVDSPAAAKPPAVTAAPTAKTSEGGND